MCIYSDWKINRKLEFKAFIIDINSWWKLIIIDGNWSNIARIIRFIGKRKKIKSKEWSINKLKTC